MTRPVEIPRKALLRAVPAYEDARLGGESSTAAMHAALVAARPYLMPSREQIEQALYDAAVKVYEPTLDQYTDAVMALLNGEIKKGEDR